MARFDVGKRPQIAVFNRAQTALGVSLGSLLAALQRYASAYLQPVWGTPCKLVAATGFLPGMWALEFTDVMDAPGALAYHDLTPDGLPYSKVFVKTILEAGSSVSVAASHELAEMLVDPGVNLMATGPDRHLVYALEACDPVEETEFKVLGQRMSNFVYPSYFEDFRARGSDRFDACGEVSSPFELLPGGYQVTFKNGVWSNVFGSVRAQQAYAASHAGHRSEVRGREPQRASAQFGKRLREKGQRPAAASNS